MPRCGWGWTLRGPLLIALPLVFLLTGCGTKHGWLDTYKVKGVVHVDGKPAAGVHLAMHPKTVSDKRPFVCSAESDENGEFAMTTFVTGDGMPAGEYDVTFTWPLRKNPISTLWEGDKLKGRYADKAKAVHQVTVEKKAQELEPFKLTTSGALK
jgi:hypothetical protein